jgi:hypothetical protein
MVALATGLVELTSMTPVAVCTCQLPDSYWCMAPILIVAEVLAIDGHVALTPDPVLVAELYSNSE